MSIDEQYIPAPPPRPVYSRHFFEAGTWRIIIIAAAVLIAYLAYGMIRSYFLLQKHWPPLKPVEKGLTVLALLDGDHPRYKAIEANHAWQIRRPDDEEASDEPADREAERGNDPGSSHQTVKGRVVLVPELMENLPVVLTGQHFSSAWVDERAEPMFDRRYYIVHVSLTDEGRSRYWQFSRDHEGERLVFVLNGEISICPRMQHMDVSQLDIEQYWVKADADKLADNINGKR